jgi:uncharacterized Rmd1/YagE family protein
MLLEIYRTYTILVAEKVEIKTKSGELILSQEYSVEEAVAMGLARSFVDVDIEERIKQTIDNTKELENEINNSLM